MVAPVAIETLHERVESLLHRGDTRAVVGILRRLHPADSSEILYRLSHEFQNLILQEPPGKRLPMYWKNLMKRKWSKSFKA